MRFMEADCDSSLAISFLAVKYYKTFMISQYIAIMNKNNV